MGCWPRTMTMKGHSLRCTSVAVDSHGIGGDSFNMFAKWQHLGWPKNRHLGRVWNLQRLDGYIWDYRTNFEMLGKEPFPKLFFRMFPIKYLSNIIAFCALICFYDLQFHGIKYFSISRRQSMLRDKNSKTWSLANATLFVFMLQQTLNKLSRTHESSLTLISFYWNHRLVLAYC